MSHTMLELLGMWLAIILAIVGSVAAFILAIVKGRRVVSSFAFLGFQISIHVNKEKEDER